MNSNLQQLGLVGEQPHRHLNPLWTAAARSTILSHLSETLFRMLSSNDASLVVDMCCGPSGTCAVRFATCAKLVLAYDVSPEAISSLDSLLRDTKTSNVRASLHDVCTRWPLDDNSIDLITGVGALSNLDHAVKALHEAARVLKPGGLLLLGDFIIPAAVHEVWGVISALRYGRRRPYLDYGQYMDLLDSTGFEVEFLHPCRWRYLLNRSLSALPENAQSASLQAIRDMDTTSKQALRMHVDGDVLTIEHDCFALRARKLREPSSWVVDETTNRNQQP